MSRKPCRTCITGHRFLLSACLQWGSVVYKTANRVEVPDTKTRAGANIPVITSTKTINSGMCDTSVNLVISLLRTAIAPWARGWKGRTPHPTAHRSSPHLTQSVPGTLSTEKKGSRRDTDHSPPSSARIKNCGAMSPWVFLAWCLIN
jgi:hypothetical protein